MSFGNNVLYYRKKCGITQEELAERMEVTRQTVSRWETDSAFPDMEKLLKMCDLFGCNMEVLVRGDAESEGAKERGISLAEYDRHQDTFAFQITAGTTLILAGLVAMMFIFAFGGGEMAGVFTFLFCITIAVVLFVASGISHDNFMKENPRAEDYPQERVRAFRHKMPWLFSGATALILLGLIALIAMTYREGYAPEGFTVERWETFSAGIFLLCVTIAVGIYVYTGMIWSKYDAEKYNKECIKKGYAEDCGRAGTQTSSENSEKRNGENPGGEYRTRKEKLSGAISGAIMLTATAIYLFLGFVRNLWHPGWVVFPIGGILCGIISTIFDAMDGGK